MGSLAVVPAVPSEDPPPPKDGPATTDLLAVVNVALAGVGGVYLMTPSLLVTLIAAVSAVILAGLASLVR